jgi:ligand-binding sensor domain-containing protein
LGFAYQGGGLALFDGINWTIYNRDNTELPIDNINYVIIDNMNHVWIGSTEGMAKFDREIWTFYTTSNSDLPASTVSTINIDIKGNKWIGTWGGSFAKFDGINWTIYNSSTSVLSSNIVASFVIDSNNTKWIGTRNGGLCEYNENSEVSVEKKNKPFISEFSINQNNPNPFNSTTIITYTLNHSDHIKLIIYDPLGREVQTLVDEYQSAGSHSFMFNANPLASGIYFYKLYTSKNFVKT